MRRRRIRGYKFTEKTQSKRGMSALGLSGISLAVLVAVTVNSFWHQGNGSMYLGSAGVAAMLRGIVGSVEVLKTMNMVLLDDVIEIDAGDTYAYDTEGNKTKRERELKAADRIFGLLPAEQAAEYRGLWDEFEAMETAEAKFANMLDKVQPLLLNDASGGKSWAEHGVKKSQVLARNTRTHEGSEELWAYAKSLIEKNEEAGRLLDE